MDETILLTQKLVQIDSTNPGAYEKEIGEFIENWLRKNVPQVEIEKAMVLPERFNLRASLRGQNEPSDQPALVYICHQDTVVLGENWQKSPPLAGAIIEGKLYGRGACDMKSGLACAMMALKKTAERVAAGQVLKRDFVLIATADEEAFMAGVEKVITDKWVTAGDFILDTEPTNGALSMAHKGRTWVEITVTGVPAHASTPEVGADAILAAARIILELQHYFQSLPEHQSLGRSTVTFGKICGGDQPYVVPDVCQMWLDMRFVPPITGANILTALAKILQQVAADMPGIQTSYQVTGDRPAIEENLQSPFVKNLAKAVQVITETAAVYTPFTGYTDTAVIAGKLKNPHCLSYGPGDLELAHKPDEYVPLKDITRCQQVLTLLAKQLCLD